MTTNEKKIEGDSETDYMVSSWKKDEHFIKSQKFFYLKIILKFILYQILKATLKQRIDRVNFKHNNQLYLR